MNTIQPPRDLPSVTDLIRTEQMEHPSYPPNRTLLQLSLPERPSFSWTDYLHVLTLTNVDLDHLITECSYAAAVLKDERDRRQVVRGGRIQYQRESLVKHFQKFRGPPFPCADIKLLEPTTDPTRWLIARLTGLDFSAPRLSRMALADQAGVVRLALNSSLYPPRDEQVPEESPVVAGNVSNLPYLPEQAWELARLIYYAGNNVPRFFFSTQKVSWSEDGEIDIREIHSSLPLGFLDDLERFQLLHIIQSSGQETYSLCSLISDQIPPSTSIKEAGQWKMRALKHVFDIFPQTGETEPISYTQKGDSLLPILRKVSPQMWSNAAECSDTEFLAAAFEGFLAATNFGDFTWKIQAIQVAERLALLTNNHVDICRVSLRHYALRRLDPLRRKQPIPSLPFTISHIQATNKRDNAFMGQFTLMKTQALMDEGASSSDVYESTRTFQVLDPNEISRQEDLVLLQCRFLYAESLRYDGRFEQAAEFFNQVLGTAKQLKSPLMLKVVIQYAELESERGNHAVALQFLGQDKEYLSSAHRLELGSGKRLTLALAYAHIMKALDDMIRIDHRDDVALGEAARLFNWLQDTYKNMGQVGLTFTQGIFQACCGLAMIYHIRQETEQAFHWWGKAKVAANRRWPEPGYAIMIATYSQSQLAFQLRLVDAVELSQQAKQVWNSIGRRRCYHFTGLGTLWPDWIGYHEEQQLRQRLIPLHQQG